jgi:hypothetical protein
MIFTLPAVWAQEEIGVENPSTAVSCARAGFVPDFVLAPACLS